MMLKAAILSVALFCGLTQFSQAADPRTPVACAAGPAGTGFTDLTLKVATVPVPTGTPGVFTEISPAIFEYPPLAGSYLLVSASFPVIEADAFGCDLGGGFEITNGLLNYIYVVNLRLVAPELGVTGDPSFPGGPLLLYHLVADIIVPGGTTGRLV